MSGQEEVIFNIRSLRPYKMNIMDDINNEIYNNNYDNDLLRISGGVIRPLKSRSPIPFDIIETEHMIELNKKLKKGIEKTRI